MNSRQVAIAAAKETMASVRSYVPPQWIPVATIGDQGACGKISMYSVRYLDFIGHVFFESSVFLRKTKWFYNAACRSFEPLGCDVVIRDNMEKLGDISEYLHIDWRALADSPADYKSAHQIIDSYYDSYFESGVDCNYCLCSDKVGVFDEKGALIYIARFE